jgi:hypothetical protein
VDSQDVAATVHPAHVTSSCLTAPRCRCYSLGMCYGKLHMQAHTVVCLISVPKFACRALQGWLNLVLRGQSRRRCYCSPDTRHKFLPRRTSMSMLQSRDMPWQTTRAFSRRCLAIVRTAHQQSPVVLFRSGSTSSTANHVVATTVPPTRLLNSCLTASRFRCYSLATRIANLKVPPLTIVLFLWGGQYQ